MRTILRLAALCGALLSGIPQVPAQGHVEAWDVRKINERAAVATLRWRHHA